MGFDFRDDCRACDLAVGCRERATRCDRPVGSRFGMRQPGLLKAADERGSATIQFPIAVLIVMVLTLGVVQVSFALYGRNVLAASAHEGARAAAENGRTLSDASVIATEVIRRATGRMAERIQVTVSSSPVLGAGESVRVQVRAALRPLGVLPIAVPITVEAEVTNPRTSDEP